MTTERNTGWALLAAGLLPIAAVNGAYAMNLVDFQVSPCWPYWEGCVSISRGVRSGPGLWLFRGLMLPVALLLAWAWHALRGLPQSSPLRPGPATSILGMAGALCLVFYVVSLGMDGMLYKFMRRFGVIVYFGGTALAQLLLARQLLRAGWQRRGAMFPWLTRCYIAAVGLLWFLGVGFSTKRLFIFDPERLDAVESMVEWNFALLLSLVFVLLGWMQLRSARGREGPPDG